MAGILRNLLAGQAGDVGQKACALPGVIGFDGAARFANRVVGDTTVTSYQPDVFFCDQRVASTLPS